MRDAPDRADWGFDLEGLSFGWNNEPLACIETLSLRFGPGRDALQIVGASGSGKSTMLYVIAGLLSPLSGKVTFHPPEGKPIVWGVDTGSQPGQADAACLERMRKDYFGFVFQRSDLLPFLTVGRGIHSLIRSLPAKRAKIALRDVRKATRVILKRDGKELPEGVSDAEILADDDLFSKGLFAKYPQELSGGQRQRCSLLRAIASAPTMMFADEPTSSLDGVSRRLVLEAMREWLNAEMGNRSIAWVTHVWEDAEIVTPGDMIFIGGTNDELLREWDNTAWELLKLTSSWQHFRHRKKVHA